MEHKMNKDKRIPDKKHLRLVERSDDERFNRDTSSDYSDRPFELGEKDFGHSPDIREDRGWSHPGLSGKIEGDTPRIEREDPQETDFTGYGPKGYMRSDDRIYEEVCEALMKNHAIDASHIGVKVENGVVFLSGKVDSRRMKEMAELILDDLPGVRLVRNELAVIKGLENKKGPDSATKKDLGIY